MDVRETEAASQKNNGTIRWSRTREVSSRSKSPVPSTPSASRRCVSPNTYRTVSIYSQLGPKRALSAERKRPTTPTSPKRSSTPVHDTSAETQLASRKIMGSRLTEGLWPSTMRSLSVSFQSDTISVPISKKEKPVSHAISDRALRPSSNVAHKKAETQFASRNPTPERKRSPFKGKNVTNQSENSKPVEGSHARLVVQHRWPSRTGGKATSCALTRSLDLTDKVAKNSTSLNVASRLSPGKMSPDSLPHVTSKPLQKSTRDALRRIDLTDKMAESSTSPNVRSGLSLTRMSLDSLPDAISKPLKKSSGNAVRPIDLRDKMAESSTLPNVGCGSLMRLSLDSFPDVMSKPVQKSTNDALRRMDLTDKMAESSTLQNVRSGLSLGRMSLDSLPDVMSKPVQKSTSDAVRRIDFTDKMAESSTLPSVGCGLSLGRISLDSLPDVMSKPVQKSTSDAVRRIDFTDKMAERSTLPNVRSGLSLRRMSFDSLPDVMSKPLQKLTSDAVRRIDFTDKMAESSTLPSVRSGLSLGRISIDSLPDVMGKALQKSTGDAVRQIDFIDKMAESSNLSMEGTELSCGRMSLDSLPDVISEPLQKSTSDTLRRIDLSDKMAESSALTNVGSVLSPRRTSLDSLPDVMRKPLQKSTSDGLRQIDLPDEMAENSTLTNVGSALSLGRMSLNSIPDVMSKPLQKSTSDALGQISCHDGGNRELQVCPVGDNKLHEHGLHKSVSSCPLERMTLMDPPVRSQSLPTTSCPPSTSEAFVSPSFLSRGVSPFRIRIPSSTSRAVSPCPSPSRPSTPSRPSSPSRQSSSSTSVLSFIADIMKGKKGAQHIEDAHQLRLLYNRQLQWRYANARANATLYKQRIRIEKTLFSVWIITSELWDSVTEKRIDLQLLRFKLKLYSVLNQQMAYLEDWASVDKDHTSSLSQAIDDLLSSTFQLPVTGGAMVEIETVKAAVCSAVDVMRAMGSSIRSILLRVEGINCLVSELADVAAQERAVLNECETLLASTAAMQVEECSLRTHLLQLKHTLKVAQPPMNYL
ncbi:hypothetical protein NMG60_11005670 [Bertholletia excelsa]